MNQQQLSRDSSEPGPVRLVRAPIEIGYWEPPGALARTSHRRNSVSSRLGAALIALAAHALWFWAVVLPTSPNYSDDDTTTDSLSVELVTPIRDRVNVIEPAAPTIDIPVQIPIIDLPRVTARPPTPTVGRHPFVVPQLDPSSRTDVGPYARKAGLAPGRRAIVILAVDVGADGLPTRVLIESSSNDAFADAAAADYARSLKWIPGEVNGQASAMRIRFTVSLTLS